MRNTGDKHFGTMWKVNCGNVRFDFDKPDLEVPHHHSVIPCSIASAEYASAASSAASPGSCVLLVSVMISSLLETCKHFMSLNGKMQVCDDYCDNIVQHDCLTFEGQAGSAMWSGSGHNQSIRAIVTGARTLSDGTVQNVGIKLNAFVYNTLSAWYKEDASETEPLTRVPVPPSSPASHHKSGHDTLESFLT